MLSLLQERIGLDDNRLPVVLRDVGNTVSSTLPILIDEMRRRGRLQSDRKNLLVGFGVGWSWAGCVWKDVYAGRRG
jgi:3-oxoacyl-[acyl-carrier-protein] synthase-3